MPDQETAGGPVPDGPPVPDGTYTVPGFYVDGLRPPRRLLYPRNAHPLRNILTTMLEPAEAVLDPGQLAVAQAAAREAEAVRRREYHESLRKEHEAWRAAEQALLAWLTPAQTRDYYEHHHIMVTSDQGNVWRIRASGQSGNVDRMGTYPGRTSLTDIESFCAHPYPYVTDPAAWLAQLLVLSTNEACFVAVAYRQ